MVHMLPRDRTGLGKPSDWFRYLGATVTLLAAVIGVAFVALTSWLWVIWGEKLGWLSPLYLVTAIFAADSGFMARDFLIGDLVLKSGRDVSLRFVAGRCAGRGSSHSEE